MKNTWRLPDEEMKILFKSEWYRAKHSLKPYLDRQGLPHLFISSRFERLNGLCYYASPHTIYLRIGGRKYRNSVIILNEKLLDPDSNGELLRVMRHEFVHCGPRKHGSKFRSLENQLR